MAEINLDDDFDFGFTTVSEDVFLQAEATVQEGQAKAEAMYKMIVPLLNNLAKDADKNAYIHWPNRAVKIEQFKLKLQQLLNS
jgi:hypothetical protein